MTTPVGTSISGEFNDLVTVGTAISSQFNLQDEQAVNAGFIFDMDEALEKKLRGIKVFDRESGGPRATGSKGRPVFVYFANGDTEVTDRQWPYITITLIGFTKATSREHRGENFLSDVHYEVGGISDPAASSMEMQEWAIPYDFTWLVQVHSRNFQHDRQVQLALEQDDKIPTRFGWLQVNDTVRILTRDSGPIQTDFLSGNPPKRVFRKSYTVTATAEFYRSQLEQFATIQHIDLGDIAVLT